jgi:opacity protein-like surface antigen
MLNDSDVSDSTVPGVSAEADFDNGYALGMALGYSFQSTRIEAELAYQENGFDNGIGTVAGVGSASARLSGDSNSLAFLVNGYFDFKNSTPVTPFITAGLGFAKIEVDDLNIPGSGLPHINDNDTVFAYQIGMGIGYALSERITIDTNYRYFATADPEFGPIGTTEAEYSSHNIFIGFRITY